MHTCTAACGSRVITAENNRHQKQHSEKINIKCAVDYSFVSADGSFMIHSAHETDLVVESKLANIYPQKDKQYRLINPHFL